MQCDKIKVGTVLDSATYSSLKQVAAKQHRRVSDLIGLAISQFLQEPPEDADRRHNTLRLLQGGIQLSNEGFREVMELDYYEQ